MEDDKKIKFGKTSEGNTVDVDNDQLGENVDKDDTLYSAPTDKTKDTKTKGPVTK